MPTHRYFNCRGRKKKLLIKPLSGGEPSRAEAETAVPAATVYTVQKEQSQPVTSMQERRPRRSTSLGDLLKNSAEQQNVSVTQMKEANSDFSQEDLEKYWTEYANTLDITKIHLKNTLLSCKPVLKENHTFEVGVYNPAQKDEISENVSVIISFLFSRLNNSHLKMTIHILEKDEKEMIYTPAEKYNYLNKKNPGLEKLMEALNLGME